MKKSFVIFANFGNGFQSAAVKAKTGKQAVQSFCKATALPKAEKVAMPLDGCGKTYYRTSDVRTLSDVSITYTQARATN